MTDYSFLVENMESLLDMDLATLQSAFSNPLVAGCTVLLVTWVLVSLLGSLGKAPLPPGPMSVPLLGSLSVLYDFMRPSRRRPMQLELPRKYGKMCTFKIGSTRMVWLNDMELVREAFVSKSEVLSDRMKDSTNRIDVLFRRGKGVASVDYGKEFKERKQLALHSMAEFGLKGKSVAETVVEEANCIIEELGKVANTGRPTDIHGKILYMAVSNVICSVAFGRRFEYTDKVFVDAVLGIKHILGNRLVIQEETPILRSTPRAKKNEAECWRHANIVINFIDREIKAHKEDFDASMPRDLVDIGLQKAAEGVAEAGTIGYDHILRIILDLFFAGTDTTSASLNWAVLYMARFPEVQRRCQMEIDRVLGRDGDLTQMSLIKDFPYTMAALWEVQRISSIAPLTLPHRARTDTVLGGYRIPKDSLVQANICFLHMDERAWPDPEAYRPERWLNEDGTANPSQPNFVPFSIGKRKCLGENLAKNEYGLFAISLLRRFSFNMVDPKNTPTLEGQGLIYSPQPFQVIVESR